MRLVVVLPLQCRHKIFTNNLIWTIIEILRHNFLQIATLYNYCLHMEVNIESCQPQKTTSQVLTIWCAPHMKAITVLLYRNYSNMFKTWMCCFVEDNKIISGFRKYNFWTRLKKNGFSTRFRLSGVVDRATDNLLSPSTLYVWIVHRVVSLVITSKLSCYFYIVKKYVRYNNKIDCIL